MKIKQMIGGNVTNDFLDNLAAQQYQKMHQPKKIKLTPQTYIDMNEEFEEKGDRLRLNIPTQEEIDKWQAAPKTYFQEPPKVDLVAKAWEDYNEEKKLEDNQK